MRLSLQGHVLTTGQVLEGLPVSFVLGYLGDSNLEIKFEESDRKGLRELEPSSFNRLGKSLNKTFTTHDELCALLLPSKPKARKPLLKTKKTTLEE